MKLTVFLLAVIPEEKVAVIDLNTMSKLFYEALGPKDAVKAFAGTQVHQVLSCAKTSFEQPVPVS